MQGDKQEVQRLRENVAIARVEAMRLGQTRLASLLAKSMVVIDLEIDQLEKDYARTRPQVEALKRLIGSE